MASVDWSWSPQYSTPSLNQKISQSSFQDRTLFATIPEHLPLTHEDIVPTPTSQVEQSNPAWSLRPSRPTLTTRLSSSRKRSREDADSDDMDSSAPSTARRTPSPPKQPFSFNSDGTSHRMETNPWADELSAKLTASMRPGLGERGDSRKSIRLDRSTSASMSDIGLVAQQQQQQLDDNAPLFPPSGTTATVALSDPTVDEATQTLGIGWTTIPSNEDMKAASRGWARYVEKNFASLSDVNILWCSRSMPAYLVSAVQRPEWAWSAGYGGYQQGTRGFFLFDEELSQCRLIANGWEDTIGRLRAGLTGEGVDGVRFDGEVMKRGEGFGYGSRKVEYEAEAEPYFLSGMRMMEEEIVMQGGDGRWGAQQNAVGGAQEVGVRGGDGEGMDVD